MAGYRPGPEARRDPRDPRGSHDPRAPRGPRDPRGSREAGPPWDSGRPGRATQHRSDNTGGADGNERLTAATGAVLLVLFAAEGVTILSIHQLITVHFFLGMLLVGPVVLKIATVLYRFLRYYSGAEEYRRKGPPAPLLRLLGPFVVLTSVAVIGTGVILGVTGSRSGPWLFLHKATFVLWFAVMSIHVLAYVARLPKLIGPDLGAAGFNRARTVLAGRSTRWLLLAASLLCGLIIALLTVHLATPWTGGGPGQIGGG